MVAKQEVAIAAREASHTTRRVVKTEPICMRLAPCCTLRGENGFLNLGCLAHFFQTLGLDASDLSHTATALCDRAYAHII
jgi:hypothetical protein